VELQPVDILLGNADDSTGLLFLCLANASETLAGHFEIVRAFIVVRVDEDVDVVVPLRQHGESGRAAECVVVGMRSEQQNGLVLEFLELHRLSRQQAHTEQNKCRSRPREMEVTLMDHHG